MGFAHSNQSYGSFFSSASAILVSGYPTTNSPLIIVETDGTASLSSSDQCRC